MNQICMAAALATALAGSGIDARAGDDIDEIIVTAMPLTQRLEDVAQPTQVLAGDELRQRIEASIGETLARLPGTNASYFGPGASRPVIRGLGGERLQVLEDGLGSLDVSALSPDHAVTVESLLADQVEVLRGPATLLYGNGTVGGVVNVVTSRIPAGASDEALGGAVEVRGNSAMDERAATGRLDATLGPVGLHLDGFTRETDDVEIDGISWSKAIRAQYAADGLPVDETAGRVPNSDTDSQGGGVGASWFLDDGFAGAGYSRFETNYGVPGPGEEPGEAGVRIDMEQDRYDLASELADVLPGFGTLRLRASWNDYLHREIEADGAVGTTFDQQSFEARVSAEHAPVAGWQGAVGAQLRDTDLEATGEEAFVPASDTRNLGVFLFEELPAGRLTWQLGLRLENQGIDVAGSLPDYDDTSVNASAGLVWDFAAAWSLALNLTRAERHPAATELYADGPHLAVRRFEIGDPGLDPETALAADVTLRRIESAVRFSVTGFVNRFSDFIYAAGSGAVLDDLPVYEYRQQDADFVGFEGEVSFPLAQIGGGELTGRLLGDYVRGRFRDGAGDVPLLPPLRVGGELGWTRERFSATVSALRYANQDRVAENELSSDGYTDVGVDMAYRLDARDARVLFFVRGSNLLDDEARRSTSPLKEFAPLPGLNLAAGARVEF